MLDKKLLDKDQQDLIDRLYNFDETIVYATMGSGKSICYLTAFSELLADGVLKKALIVAPLKPCEHVWSSEHLKWSHTAHLKIAVCTGSEKNRLNALKADSDILVVNIENLAWLVKKLGKKHPFDALCIDELSKFSATGNASFRALRKIAKSFKHRVGLTGTPVHEGFDKLYAQVMLIDGGERLGTRKDKFLREYFFPTDYNEYNWELKEGADARIMRALRGLVYDMPDYTHTLPPLHENALTVTMADDIADDYKAFKNTSVYEKSDPQVIAENEAVLSGKLEQFANGFLYNENGDVVTIHDEKNHALLEYLNAHWTGKQFLIFYQYEEDKTRISYTLEDANISFGTLDDKKAMGNFLAGKLDALLLHPKSAGHGLNLHTSGCAHIICYCPIWSNDQFKQLIGRLWRRGAGGAVNVLSIVTAGTIDEIKMKRIESKAEYDKAFKRHVNA